MKARPVDVRPGSLRRGVVQGESQPCGPLDQRLDCLEDQASRDAIVAAGPAPVYSKLARSLPWRILSAVATVNGLT